MKILCLGNNTRDTDAKTRKLAQLNSMACHGLLSELESPVTEDQITEDGYYHSSVYDIEFGRLLDLAKKFDSVVILDQSKEQYTHPNAFYKTIRLARQLKKTQSVEFVDSTYEQDIDFFEKLVKTNKSFCIFPFIELVTLNNNTTVCCYSTTPIVPIKDLKDFATDPHYQEIRTKLIEGKLVPEHCESCYKLEEQNIVSHRQQQTVEWANRLNLSSIEDLSTITKPAYYEVRPNNVCNLQCRMCIPKHSNLIEREFKLLNIVSDYEDIEYSDFDIVEFDNLQKLYVAGGEPTAMPQFYNFLDRCISTGNTDFEFVINTNAVKISNKFRALSQQFSNMQFVISLDAYDRLNHYIRWPSDWETVIDNIKYLYKHHVISFNTTVSIYNVTGLFALLEYFDCNFPGILVHCQYTRSTNDILSPMKFPNSKLALESLLPIRNLRCYHNDPFLASSIEGLISNYEKDLPPDINLLKEFFEFNDKLDKSRDIKLIDYVPALEEYRKLI